MPRKKKTDAGDDAAAELANDDPDNLRILLSTDNHLGYAERDPVRGMDSFAAFEEVLYLAKKTNCDMVVLAGDLFHENRPTRRTLHKTMEIMRRYCMVRPFFTSYSFLSSCNQELKTIKCSFLCPRHTRQLTSRRTCFQDRAMTL